MHSVLMPVLSQYLGAKNVVNACRECKVKRLIYNSSADVVIDITRDILNGDESLPYPDQVCLWLWLLNHIIDSYVFFHFSLPLISNCSNHPPPHPPACFNTVPGHCGQPQGSSRGIDIICKWYWWPFNMCTSSLQCVWTWRWKTYSISGECGKLWMGEGLKAIFTCVTYFRFYYFCCCNFGNHIHFLNFMDLCDFSW